MKLLSSVCKVSFSLVGLLKWCATPFNPRLVCRRDGRASVTPPRGVRKKRGTPTSSSALWKSTPPGIALPQLFCTLPHPVVHSTSR
jgi:hypothetical protein